MQLVSTREIIKKIEVDGIGLRDIGETSLWFPLS